MIGLCGKGFRVEVLGRSQERRATCTPPFATTLLQKWGTATLFFEPSCTENWANIRESWATLRWRNELAYNRIGHYGFRIGQLENSA